ncbi:MAG: hypothetical protein ABSF98_11320 [Bryobacteraceae bacterium]|jgi:hypothetical protein
MKLRRAALPDPLLLFLVALIGGTLWLLAPVPDAAALLRPDSPAAAVPPPPPRAQPPQPRSMPNPADLRAELEAAEKAMRERAAALDAQNAEIEMLQRRVDALRAQLEALQARPASTAPAASPSDEESRMENLVKERQVEIAHLESELASLTAPAVPVPDTRRIPRAVGASQKLPLLVDLSGNRIAPVNGEFFRFPMFPVSSRIVATRKKPGETIAEARAPNSQFARFLSKIHSGREYVSCLLNGDSFEAYYAVRDMAARAGVDIAWEPADTSSGKIAIQPVRLVSKPPRNAVPLPDIMRPGAGGH